MIAAFFRRFTRDRRANAAVIFAIALVPLTGTVGAAVDFSRRGSANAKLQAAADAAALAAVSTQRGNRREIATTTFNSNVSTDSTVRITDLSTTVSEGESGVTVTVSYRGEMQTSISAAIGFSTINLSGTATATRGGVGFVDFNFVLDTSSSMEIAADQQGLRQLMALTLPMLGTSDRNYEPEGCAFACHGLAVDQVPGTPTFAQVARNNNIPVRFDIIKSALNDVASIIQREPNSSRIRVGLYSFDTLARQILAPSASMSAVRTALASLSTDCETNNHAVLQWINQNLGAPGRGTSAADPRKVIIFATDGVLGGRNNDGHNPWNVADCNALKQRGFSVAVIHTTYIEFSAQSGSYNSWIRPMVANVAPAMRACASDGLYFEAAYTAQIRQAFSDMVRTVLNQSTTRLSR
ncbi:MAG: vWA domain-containing protein [Alphaproteobacteria bacterium]